MLPANTVTREETAIMAHGTFVWNELLTRNVDAAKSFYAGLVDWSFKPFPTAKGIGTYWVAELDGKPVAGIMAMQRTCRPMCRRTGSNISKWTTWTRVSSWSSNSAASSCGHLSTYPMSVGSVSRWTVPAPPSA